MVHHALLYFEVKARNCVSYAYMPLWACYRGLFPFEIKTVIEFLMLMCTCAYVIWWFTISGYDLSKLKLGIEFISYAYRTLWICYSINYCLLDSNPLKLKLGIEFLILICICKHDSSWVTKLKLGIEFLMLMCFYKYVISWVIIFWN